MSDHMPYGNTAVRSGHFLAHIADALDVPPSAFHEPCADRDAVRQLAQMAETALLTLVQDHLHRSDPEGRARFVETVKAMAGNANL
ncbi:hypothetical protein MPOCJGCO_3902 [Methylobacterium trifolii]|uniref:Uncharacterized protein n=1 Tax=Methylobacterium trifolii TaxID=1003092 RepID=A0ABQ4U4T3_9HYPH|nr:hypothetical protein MPOCJGCO_3902 [Methylobacterium trifolii]